MEVVGFVALVFGLAALAVAVFLVRRIRAEGHRLPHDGGAPVTHLPESLRNGDRQFLTVELLDPAKLARRYTVLARPLSALTPTLLRELVYSEAVKQVRRLLDEHDIDADIQVHRTTQPARQGSTDN
ncbi:hypothetical protein [Herbihabitans rhizosphaerae]|uniref:hypothetical protein n=1 Tax=Herbihabitans rhizosphaerae TaxID=1872711 RepID=UPI001F5EB016|nr:hypothetical protein [Herbihabitans rhizosphaerae]